MSNFSHCVEKDIKMCKFKLYFLITKCIKNANSYCITYPFQQFWRLLPKIRIAYLFFCGNTRHLIQLLLNNKYISNNK